nr:MAG TPA: hypothetical protein [Caudoviricetes sp.]
MLRRHLPPVSSLIFQSHQHDVLCLTGFLPMLAI